MSPQENKQYPHKLDQAMLRRFVFQTFGRARRTQDSPVVPDVWLRYMAIAEVAMRARFTGEAAPNSALDLLLTPWSGSTPGQIAKSLREQLNSDAVAKARIAQSTSRVVVRIDFTTLVQDVVPLTGWWRRLSRHLKEFLSALRSLELNQAENTPLPQALADAGIEMGSIRYANFIEFFRYASLVGFIDGLMNTNSPDEVGLLERRARRLGPRTSDDEDENAREPRPTDQREPTLGDVKPLLEGFRHAAGEKTAAWNAAAPVKEERLDEGRPNEIYLINLNRPAAQSLFESRKTVKADAAQRVFEINTEGITFAVIDGGIDATHPAFLNWSDSDADPSPREYLEGLFKTEKFTLPKEDIEDRSRIAATFDFTMLRDILACEGQVEFASPAIVTEIKRLVADPESKTALDHIKIRNDNGRDLDWEMVRPLIARPHDKSYAPPGSDHGTHVAGILAADMRHYKDLDRQEIAGMCPSLSLYDMRVFNNEGVGDEFAILSALEFVGWLNRDRANPVVHGVNLSLALAHDVDSFACGQTPICEVCNHLVDAGTVVVAAAGNTGFDGAAKQSMGTGYRPISITDPGNADRVITVGSTHRRDPHAYGVSYFSARGPTGDGRRKPDILAPGEKITSTIRNGRTQRMDGTSMAAPHVAGAAALLMARYPELIGRPLQIKEILMKTATDLNREPSFQGAGLVDVLRALQSV